MNFSVVKLLNLIHNNKKIIENYFFMTILQLLNSFFYLLIYPFVIRKVGMDAWGVFVFATSVAAYFVFLINFGFDLPATKRVAENINNIKKLNKIFMLVLYAKNLLFIITSFIFFFCLFNFPVLQKNKSIFVICYFQIYSYILIPPWFFQGLQNMKYLTIIQFVFKILSLPLIFLYVHQSQDIIYYALIVTLTSLLSGLLIFLQVLIKYKFEFVSISYIEIKALIHESKPFFYSSISSSIKEYSIPIIIGSFLDMRGVAIYDLANKIILVPRTLFLSINAAIFPKLIVNIKHEVVKKIIKCEFILSILAISIIILFGKNIVIIMGGEEMLQAYPLSILISITVMSWLVVGAYVNFVFLPNSAHPQIIKNQILATFSFFIICFAGIFFITPDINIIGIAIALSGIIEILYCIIITKNLNLLR